MAPTPISKVSATINGRRYSAALAGENLVILGQGRALATGRFADGKVSNLRPSPPDVFIQIPIEDLDVVETLADELQLALERGDSPDGLAALG